MIFLHSVAKTYFSKHDPPNLALRPTTIALPTDRRVAILGGRLQGKSTLLRLLSGEEAPDAGGVLAPLSLSPIANTGALFHPRFSPVQNIRLVARMLGIDAHGLATLVGGLCGIGAAMERPVLYLGAAERQRLDIALLSLLSFDCYLLDDARRVPAELLEGYFEAATRRGAGVIFTTNVPRQVYEYADHAIVLRDRTVHEFDHVEEAIKSYERRAG